MNHDLETLDLTPDELCALIQGLRAQICNRLYWMMTPKHPIRERNLGDEAETLDSMTQAYTKALLVARASPNVVEEFKSFFMLSDEAWEALDQIERAKSWSEVPMHRHTSPLTCGLCEELILAH